LGLVLVALPQSSAALTSDALMGRTSRTAPQTAIPPKRHRPSWQAGANAAVVRLVVADIKLAEGLGRDGSRGSRGELQRENPSSAAVAHDLSQQFQTNTLVSRKRNLPGHHIARSVSRRGERVRRTKYASDRYARDLVRRIRRVRGTTGPAVFRPAAARRRRAAEAFPFP